MANRRDLHIGISGDSAGFDRACQDAEEKARGLDRELEKLTKDLTAQERVAARTAVAVKQYGSEQDKAALAARRLGTEAEKAALQAEQAQTRADAAAKAYERGLIDEEKALRAAARAEDATERAALKAAEAHRAAARAADEQAQQERQLARDAELAAAAEELGMLKASGRVKEHNALLGSLQGKYGDLSKTAVEGFQEIETVGSKAASGISGMIDDLSILGKSGPVSLGLIAAAIEVLPTVATAAGGAVALGLGGALSLVAIKAQASTADVKSAFAGLKTDVGNDLRSISAPFHQTMLEIAADALAAFKSLEPALAAAFAQMAPAITRFVRYFAVSLGQLDPAIRSIGTAFSTVLDTLGPQMGTIMNNIGTGIKAITDAVASNPQALANFATGLSEIVRYTGDAIGFLIRYSSQINAVFKAIDEAINPFAKITGLFGHVKSSTEAGGTALAKYTNTLGQVPGAMSATLTPTQQLAKDMQVLATATTSAEDKAKAITDAFKLMLDPQVAVHQDITQLQQGIDGLGAALARSGGRMDSIGKSSLDARNAFDGLLKTAQGVATDMLKSGDSIDQVQQTLRPYIAAMYQATGTNKDARSMLDGFVKSLGGVPPLTDRAGRAIGEYGGTLDGLKIPTTAAQLQSRQLAEDMQILANETATADDKANALSDAFTRLLDPALAAYQDTAKLRQGLDDLAAALKKSHGAMNDNSAAARASKDAFASVLKDAEQYAGELLRSGDSLDVVQRKLAPYILSLYKVAGGNRDARALVNAFAKAVGLVPNKKGTTLTSNAAAQKKAIEAYQRSINNLRGKTVDIYQVMHLTQTQAYLNQRKNILGYSGGGIVHRATGGPVQHLADGGPSGMVSGPGTGTSDSILTALSNGEFVTNAVATRQYRPLLEAINSGRPVPVASAVVSGVSGGAARPAPAGGVDVQALGAAVARALHGVTVQMDGKPVGQIVSRHLGQQTDLRRRTG